MPDLAADSKNPSRLTHYCPPYYSQILRLYVFGPSGFWIDYGFATLRSTHLATLPEYVIQTEYSVEHFTSSQVMTKVKLKYLTQVVKISNLVLTW